MSTVAVDGTVQLDAAEVTRCVELIKAGNFASFSDGSGVRFINWARQRMRAGEQLPDATVRAALDLLQSGTRAIEGRPKTAAGTSRSVAKAPKKSSAELLGEL